MANNRVTFIALIEVDTVELECSRIPRLYLKFWVNQILAKCSHLNPKGGTLAWFPAKAKKIAKFLKACDEIQQWDSIDINKEKWWHEGRWWTDKERKEFLDRKYGKQTQN